MGTLPELYSNLGATTLSGNGGSITNVATTMIVASAASLPVIPATGGQYTIIVESEIMKVTGASGTTLTVVRAQEGTAGASHNDGVAVTHVDTAGVMQRFPTQGQAFAMGAGNLVM